jgi:hypothetical protein
MVIKIVAREKKMQREKGKKIRKALDAIDTMIHSVRME